MPTWLSTPRYAAPPVAGGPAQPLFGCAPVGRYAAPAALPSPQRTTLLGGSGQPSLGGLTHFLVKTVGGSDFLYALCGGTTVYAFTLAGSLVQTTTLPFAATAQVFAVDDSGNYYVSPASAADHISKVSPAGSTLWSTNPGVGSLGGIAWQGSGSSFALLLSGLSASAVTSGVVDTTGASQGTSAVLGTYCCADPQTGGFLTTWQGYVCFWSRAGALLQKWGQSSFGFAGPPTGHTGTVSFMVFLGPDGLLYGAGSHGVFVYTRDGFPVGGQSQGALLGSMDPNVLAQPILFKDAVYVHAAGDQIQSVPWADWQAAANAPSQPYDFDPNGPLLGPGAALSTPASANYFAPGHTPSCQLTLDPWWTLHSADTQIQVTVRERSQVLERTPVPVQTLSIPGSAPGGGSIVLPIALAPDQARPGFYVVEAQAVQNGTVRSADRLFYSVGCRGATLDFGTLAAAPDYGDAAAPARYVGLAAVLGGGVRLFFDFSRTLSSASSTDPLSLGVYDSTYQAAAGLAQQLGVTIEVQVGTGTAFDKALVSNGTWGARVQELVTHYKDIIHTWEAWNEPNESVSATTYVSGVLQPFYNGVKAADPTAQVVGGSVLGADGGALAYWTTMCQNGALAYVDIIAFHPYTGNNKSWEEDGWLRLLPQLQTLWNAHGGGGKPLWITEIGWWSDGSYNLFAQADSVVRLLLHARALGVSQVFHWLLEAGFTPGQLDALIHYGGDSRHWWVKPAALACMTVQAQLAALPFIQALATGLPHTFAYLFGPNAAGQNILALWTDGAALPVTVSAAGPVVVTEALGAQMTLVPQGGVVRLRLDGSPRYLAVASGAAPRVAYDGPALGRNVAAASVGATLGVSSTNSATAPSLLNDELTDAGCLGGFPGCNLWASAASLVDAVPTVEVQLGRPMTIGAVVPSGATLDPSLSGLRDLDLYGQQLDGTWIFLAAARTLFYQPRPLLSFAPLPLLGLRLVGRGANVGGTAGGLSPWYQVRPAPHETSGPLALYEVEAFGAPYHVPAPSWSGPALPGGYSYGQRLVVHGGSSAVQGSRTTPVTLAASSALQDYVCSVRLDAVQSAAITDNVVDTSAGTDLGLFWWTGSGWSQIDYDLEAAWGVGRLVLRFRLQAPLGAAPAVDAGYLLAWGNRAPTVLRTRANIYPFFDHFDGTALDAAAWTTSGTAADVSVQNSVATVITPAQPPSDAGVLVVSTPSYGTGFALQARAQMPYPAPYNVTPRLGFIGSPTVGPVADLTDSLYGGQGFGLRMGTQYSSVPLGPPDNAWHICTVWRDSAGVLWGTLDAATGSFAPSGQLQTGALHLQFGIATASPPTPANSMAVDWIAVRPIIAQEPTTSLASS